MPTPLYAQVTHPDMLLAAWHEVRSRGRTPGLDGISLPRFERHLERELARLARELGEGAYHPWPSLRLHIPKASGGLRAIGVQTVRDRVAQRAVLRHLQPRIEPRLEACSYAFRPGRSITYALAALDALHQGGRAWAARGDVRLCFDSLDHARLQSALQTVVPERDVRDLIGRWLRAGVVDGDRWQDSEPGVVQGDALSPLLCNLYLDAFDEALLGAGYGLIRYADDFVLVSRTEQEARQGMQAAETALQSLSLRLNTDKQWIGTFWQGFEYLGTALVGSTILPLRPVERAGKPPRFTFGYEARPARPVLPSSPPPETPFAATQTALRDEMLRLRRAQEAGHALPAVGAALLQAWYDAGRLPSNHEEPPDDWQSVYLI